MARYQAVRGTFDILPTEMSQWHILEQKSRDLAHRFGYREIRTPLFEEADLFTRGMGVMAGLIEKELWTFQDKFGQKLALRTDATTGIIRSYQQNKLYNSKLPLKVFYLAPVFLLGKEGDNRSRQSHQFGFEAIGSDNPALDAEVVALAAAFCEGLGLEDVSIRLNSLGGKDCRPVYLQKLKDYFGSNAGQLCSTCKRKYKANPDWVLSCEEKECKSLAQVAPTIYGMLTNDAKTHFSQLREYLEEMELPVELDPRVVRDSEYYNGAVFEIQSQGKSIGFGGRYDSLVEKLGGKATPAVGFAFSLESILGLLEKPDEKEADSQPDVLLRPEGPESAKLLVPLLYTLRQRGVSAELDYSYGNGRRQRESTEGFSYLVTLDESNAFRGTAILRDLEEKSDEKVPVARLRNRVLHVAGVSSSEEKDGSKSGRKRLRRGKRRNDEDKSERDNSSSDDSSEGRSRRRSKSRRGRDNSDDREKKRGRNRDRDRDKDKDRDKDNSRDDSKAEDKNDSNDKDSSSKSRRRRGSNKDNGRDSGREKRGRDKPSKDKSSGAGEKEDAGKAIVPVFGGAPLGTEAPKKKAATKKASSKKKASKKKASKAAASPAKASAAGGLNWSILPGKEGE